MRYLFIILLILNSCYIFAQKDQQTWLKQRYSKVSFQQAYLIADGVAVNYEQLATIADSNILSVQVYSSKQAKRLFKQDGKKGAVVVKTIHHEVVDFPLKYTADSACYYIADGDTIFTKLKQYATITADDTLYVSWRRFLMKNLDPLVLDKNNAPAGLYIVRVKFIVGDDGKISNVWYEADPGYGTGDEAVRVVSLFANWQPAKYNGKAVNSIQIQPVRFVYTEE
jgi:hypothetical protein